MTTTTRLSSVLFAFSILALGAHAQSVPPRLYPGGQWAAGSSARGLASGLLNGDAIVDIVTADFAANGVNVLLGTGGGTYATPVFYAMGMGTCAVALGDLNNDGIQDLVAANATAGTVSVRLGVGAGAFGALTTYGMGAGTIDVGLADLNADGRPDLVAANEVAMTISWRFNNGAGFGALFAVATTNPPNQLALADVNADGLLDALTVNPGGGEINVALCNAAGLAAVNAFTTAAADPMDLQVLDMNADGLLDVVTGNDITNDFRILFGNGAGAFALVAAVPAGASLRSVAVADLDGDGILDLAGAIGGLGGIAIVIGMGGGAFAPPVRIPAGSTPFLVRARDFDNDGRMDLAVTNEVPVGTLTLLRNAGGGWPRAGSLPAQLLGAPAGSTVSATGDFNGDGFPDVVTIGGAANAFQLRMGDGAGNFGAPATVATAANPQDVVVLDFDNDGLLDVVTADEGAAQVTFRKGLGAGAFGAMIPVVLPSPNPRAMAAGDLENDGDVDLVVVHQDANGHITELDNQITAAAGTMIPVNAALIPGADMRDVVLHDMNANGVLDVLVPNAATAEVRYYFGLGFIVALGGFIAVPVGPGPVSLAVEDLNGDGDPDLVTSQAGGSNLEVRTGNGFGAFALVGTLPVAAPPARIVACDLTGDGLLDVAAAIPATADVAVFAGNGAAGFSPARTFAAGAGARSIAVSDVDANGRPDLVVPGPQALGSQVAILLNGLVTPPSVVLYGTGTPGCSGRLGITASSAPNLGNATFGALVTNAPPRALGLLMVGDVANQGGYDPFGILLTFHVDLGASSAILTDNASSDGEGTSRVTLPVPANPFFVGKQYHLQTLWLETNAKGLDCSPALFHLVSSRAMSVTILP